MELIPMCVFYTYYTYTPTHTQPTHTYVKREKEEGEEGDKEKEERELGESPNPSPRKPMEALSRSWRGEKLSFVYIYCMYSLKKVLGLLFLMHQKRFRFVLKDSFESQLVKYWSLKLHIERLKT